MPNIKSAKKRALTNNKRNLRNRIVKSRMKTSVKTFVTAIEAGNKDNLDAMFKDAVSAVDRAAVKGVIHKNAANHKKAQLARMMAK